MFRILLYTFLISALPFGEARLGIPFAVFNKVHYGLAFAVGLMGNLLVYPLFMWLIDRFNKKLWPHSFYKKALYGFHAWPKKEWAISWRNTAFGD